LKFEFHPKFFLGRLIKIEAALAILQLLYILIFCIWNEELLLVWFFVHAFALFGLAYLYMFLRGRDTIPQINENLLLLLLLVSFVVKLYARTRYAQGWLEEGLYAARQAEQTADQRLLTPVNFLFYPLAIIAAITNLEARRKTIAISALLIMCAVDFTFIGTRNAPTFVLLFLLLSVRTRTRLVPFMAGSALILAYVLIFNFSTVYRSGDYVLGLFDWLTVFEATHSTQILRPDMEVIVKINDSFPALLPLLFLMHYFSHSIGELLYFLENQRDLFAGGFYHIIDQFCALGFCSRPESLELVERINPRAGSYGTLWLSLIEDVGIAGAVLVYAGVLGAAGLAIATRMRIAGPVSIMVGVLLVLSPIENYAYNGVGFGSIVATVALFWLLSVSSSIRISRNSFAAPQLNESVTARRSGVIG